MFGPRLPPMQLDQLEIFSTLKRITGFLKFQVSHPEFRNLETIGGRQFVQNFSTLYIAETPLNSLQLRSFKTIGAGSVTGLENKEFCFTESISWTKIMKSKLHGTLLQNNKVAEHCKESGLGCSAKCSTEGCWGLGSNECLSCANSQLNATYVES